MAGPPNLGRHRAFYLYEQSAAEAHLARQLALRLRQARRAAGLPRAALATGLGVDPALLVGIENGYGSPAAAQAVVAAAEAFCCNCGPAKDRRR